MAWKPEYAENRRQREIADPEFRKRRLASAQESQEKNREARKAYMAQYYRDNPEKFARRTPEKQAEYNARRRQAYAEDEQRREVTRQQVKAWQQANPEKRKAQRLRQFELTLEEFRTMLTEQAGKCVICGYSDTSNPKRFPLVDHCHATGKVRGLLCSNCNAGLGHFKDRPELLQAAIRYLQDRGSSGAI